MAKRGRPRKKKIENKKPEKKMIQGTTFFVPPCANGYYVVNK